MKILKAIAITGFLSAVVGQIISVFLPIEVIPTWGITIFVGIFPLGFAGIFACVHIGRSKGIWGRDKQWEYTYIKSPKWTNKMALGLSRLMDMARWNGRVATGWATTAAAAGV